ncbi:sodium- and chloride-dependent glycine transporter 1-like [Saccoglossus kowalevskii]
MATDCDISIDNVTEDKKPELDISHEIAVDRLTDTITSDGDENKTRGNWSNKLDFILSCIGYAVGLGNVWRFPYLCFSNGGGAFLIPYIIMLTLAGLPLFFLELAFGQFSSVGCISVWRISPIFKGIGYAMVIMTALVCLYYNIIITWTIFYIFASLSQIPSLPWVSCGNSWNTELCFDDKISVNQTLNSTDSNYIISDVVIGNMETTTGASVLDVILNSTLYNGTIKENVYNLMHVTPNVTNSTSNATNQIIKRPSEEYWDNHVLQITDGIDNLGGIRWELVGCFALAWVVVFLCIVKGVKSSGKVVYFTALFPYCVLIILFFRGVTLPGSMNGVLFYITPKWHILQEARVWKDAAAQIFYSLGIAWGGLQTLGSYNKFHNNCHRDALIVAFCNCGTSVFAGFVIFSIIGFMAHDAGVNIQDVAEQGAGLAFVVYPEAVARLPVSPLWAFLFFFMLFTLGLDSQFVMMETLITAIMDEMSFMSGKLRKNKVWVTLATCIIFFIVGLPMVTKGGMYILQLMDWYAASFSLMTVGFLECVIISYVYGINRFCDDCEVMIGFRPNIYWRSCWMVGAPFILGFILIFSFVSYTPCSYGDYVYPAWAEALGWVMVMSSLVAIPVYAIYHLIRKQKGTFMQRLRQSAKSKQSWGPALPEHRKLAGYGPMRQKTTPPPSYLDVVYCQVENHKEGTTKDAGHEETLF